MTIIDPKPPLRRDLEQMCAGNLRLVKAFEKLFELIPKELNRGSDDVGSAQLAADFAASQALSASSSISDLKFISELSVLAPFRELIVSDSLGLLPRLEPVDSDQLSPNYQHIECSNFNLEIT